jgi:hypothetical protein
MNDDADPVDQVVVLHDNPELDDALILRLQYDLAAKIHTYQEIAVRYGLRSVAGLFEYLTDHPTVTTGVKKIRAVWESEENAEIRVRQKALQAAEHLIAPTAGIAANPNINVQARIDAFKQLARVGGVDGLPMSAKQQGAGGTAFTLNILFRDGTKEQLTVSTGTNEVDGAAGSAITQLTPDDAPEYDEEV